jgi:type IX secretion system PorP/SprF family membrane protein
MKKTFTRCLVFAALFVFNKTYAQQDPQYSHYMFNNLVLNPAVAGTKESLSIVGLFRTQFVGVDGGPQTQTVSAHMPLERIKSGIGLHVVNDKIGFENSLNFAGNYSYIYDMGGAKLSGGISLGFIQKAVDGSKLKASVGGDRAIPEGNVNALAIDLGLGALYFTDQYYVGLSTSHLTQPSLKLPTSTGGIEYKSARHYYLTGGYNYTLNPVIDIKPSVLIKYAKSVSFDVSALAFYNQRLWAGLSYRYNDAVIGIVGFKVTNNLNLSYSYDYTLSKLNLESSGSHEVLLGYDLIFGKSIKSDVIIKTPRFL